MLILKFSHLLRGLSKTIGHKSKGDIMCVCFFVNGTFTYLGENLISCAVINLQGFLRIIIHNYTKCIFCFPSLSKICSCDAYLSCLKLCAKADTSVSFLVNISMCSYFFLLKVYLFWISIKFNISFC